MSALSSALETDLLNFLLRGNAIAVSANLHLGLFTADPGESGVVGEVSGGSYGRAVIPNNALSFPACSTTGTPVKVNGTTIVFPTASAAWGNITHWAIYDSAVGGSNGMLVHGSLSAPRIVSSGDTPRIAAGALSITVGNAASGGLTNYAKRSYIDAVFGIHSGPGYIPTVYVAVGTGLSGDALAEWEEPGYTRQPVTFGAPAAGVCLNTSALTMNIGTSVDTTPLTHYGIYDDPLLGNALVLAQLSTSRSVPAGDFAKFAASSISVKVA